MDERFISVERLSAACGGGGGGAARDAPGAGGAACGIWGDWFADPSSAVVSSKLSSRVCFSAALCFADDAISVS